LDVVDVGVDTALFEDRFYVSTSGMDPYVVNNCTSHEGIHISLLASNLSMSEHTATVVHSTHLFCLNQAAAVVIDREWHAQWKEYLSGARQASGHVQE